MVQGIPHIGSTLSVAYVPIGQLIVNPNNPRVHTDKQIQQIANGIRTLGFNVPILVDRNLQVIAGHGRLAAAKQVGLREIPTIRLEHLTEGQARAFAIADNRLTENSTWNRDVLAQELKCLSEADLNFSLEVTGFEIAEIDTFIEGISPPSRDGADPADAISPVADTVPVSKAGDFWLLKNHRVFCGNCLDESSFRTLMQDRKAAMVFIDPPFNLKIEGHVGGLGAVKHKDFLMAAGEMTSGEFTDFLAQSFNNLVQYSAKGAIHFVCSDWRHMREFIDAGYQTYSELKNLCIWAKDNAGMGSFYRSQHELIFVFKSGETPHRNNFQLGQYGRYRTNLWKYGGGNSFSRNTSEGNLLELHPTVKPVALIADAVMDVSCRGEIVLDSFLGSGSTVIACERTGRICCGMEIDPGYVDTIIRRWQKFTGLSAVHADSGRRFDELEKEATDAIR
jgi:DNA modification methylase